MRSDRLYSTGNCWGGNGWGGGRNGDGDGWGLDAILSTARGGGLGSGWGKDTLEVYELRSHDEK